MGNAILFHATIIFPQPTKDPPPPLGPPPPFSYTTVPHNSLHHP